MMRNTIRILPNHQPHYFLELNPTLMPSSTTNIMDKVQSVFEIRHKRAIQDSDDSGSDHFTRESESQRLQKDIRNWSVKFAITYVALFAVLTILKAHNLLFKSTSFTDARTLKENPTYIQFKYVDPGR